jgi:hypothetical protein
VVDQPPAPDPAGGEVTGLDQLPDALLGHPELRSSLGHTDNAHSRTLAEAQLFL